MKQYIIIENNKSKFAIDILKTQEIIQTQKLTRIPGSSPLMLGMTSVREQLYNIYDMGLVLASEKIDIEKKETKILLMEMFRNSRFGFLIEGNIEIKDIEEEDIKQVKIGNTIDNVVTIDNEIYMILDYDYLIKEIYPNAEITK